jgi:hypothetical protein
MEEFIYPVIYISDEGFEDDLAETMAYILDYLGPYVVFRLDGLDLYIKDCNWGVGYERFYKTLDTDFNQV